MFPPISASCLWELPRRCQHRHPDAAASVPGGLRKQTRQRERAGRSRQPDSTAPADPCMPPKPSNTALTWNRVMVKREAWRSHVPSSLKGSQRQPDTHCTRAVPMPLWDARWLSLLTRAPRKAGNVSGGTQSNSMARLALLTAAFPIQPMQAPADAPHYRVCSARAVGGPSVKLKLGPGACRGQSEQEWLEWRALATSCRAQRLKGSQRLTRCVGRPAPLLIGNRLGGGAFGRILKPFAVLH